MRRSRCATLAPGMRNEQNRDAHDYFRDRLFALLWWLTVEGAGAARGLGSVAFAARAFRAVDEAE